MAGAGKKTFTAGEILTASDTNTYLMEQTVMYFAGTAARASAIPTPSTGMTTYIGVTGTATIPQIETYTGSAWQTPYGMTLVAKASFTSATTMSLNNVFSSNYENYKIVYKGNGSTANQPFYMRLRASGTDAITNYFYGGTDVVYNTGGSSTRVGNGVTFWAVGQYSNDADSRTGMWMDINNPFVAGMTSMGYVGNFNGTVPFSVTGAGFHSTATSYDGFTMYPASGNASATIYVYGYRTV
jgi:hypothetical protein